MTEHKTITDLNIQAQFELIEKQMAYLDAMIRPTMTTTEKTLRDEFAMAALTGLLANPKLQKEILAQGGANSGWIEESAWAWADGMLEKRK